MEQKPFYWWIIFILLSIWQFPQLLIAGIMFPFIGKLKLIKQSKFTFCYEASKMKGGIRFTKNYYDFYTENLANYHARLETDEKGKLRFKTTS